ncbi:MAG: hypothetical protein WD988_00425 [Candidatus Curtissbacteria bacterium]
MTERVDIGITRQEPQTVAGIVVVLQDGRLKLSTGPITANGTPMRPRIIVGQQGAFSERVTSALGREDMLASKGGDTPPVDP